MRASEEAVADRTILFNHITPKMLDFKGIFHKINKPKRLKNFQSDTDFFIIIVLIIILIIVILIIYFHCVVILYYHPTQNMDIPVMTIFLTETHSPSWSPFILVRNKEIMRII